MTLKRKIFAPTIALVALMMSASIGITYYFSSKSLNEHAVNQLGHIAASRAEIIDKWIEGYKILIRSSASRAVYQGLFKEGTADARERANRDLAEQVKICPNLAYMNIADAQGVVQASSLPDSVGKVKIGDRAYFQKSMQGEPNVSDIYIARTTGQPAFSISAPIRDGEKIVGIIFGVPDLSKFNEAFIDSVKIFDSGYAAVADSTGMILAHKDKSLVMKLNLGEHEFGREMLKIKRGSLSYNFQNQNQMGFVEECKTTHWLVIATAPYAEVIGDANKIGFLNLILLAVGLTCVGLVIYLIAVSIAGPIDRVVEALSAGTERVAAEATQVSSASALSAGAASQQAASIEETSASIEEIASMTRQNAQNADQANSAMAQVSGLLAGTRSSMAELNRSMQEISKAGEETQKIVRTIDEIAFQTNLLALNAAVEAARAGEAGAGFAVVADEVRNLAMRAAEAAKNTASLIEGTVKRVNDGSERVGQTEKEFYAVALNIERSSELVGQISAASLEQAQGIEHVNKAVSEMDRVVQQNASSAEESASASEEMSAQAQQMKDVVGDLRKLIRGTNRKTTRNAESAGAKKIVTSPSRIFAASAKGANGHLKKGNGKAETRPEKLIPFDDREFSDF